MVFKHLGVVVLNAGDVLSIFMQNTGKLLRQCRIGENRIHRALLLAERNGVPL